MKDFKRLSLFYIFLIGLPIIISFPAFLISSSNYKFKEYLTLQFPIYKAAYYTSVFIQAKTLKNHTISNVHVGADDWLFYFTQNDGNSFLDYMEIPSQKIEEKWQTYLSNKASQPYGFEAHYFFITPPNKERIYPELVRFPLKSLHRERQGNYFLVTNLLKESFPENFIDLETPLHEAKQEALTYYKLDTHWNSWGSYIAHNAILKKISQKIGMDFDIREVTDFNHIEASYKDLLPMLSGADRILNIATVNSLSPEPVISNLCCAQKNEEIGYVAYTHPDRQKVLWLVGDSFSLGLEKYLPLYFQTTIFIRRGADAKTLNSIADKYGKPDIIIDEFVERYLSTLAL